MSRNNKPLESKIEQKGNFGIGINQGEVHTQNLSGSIDQSSSQNLVESAREIQKLLEHLEKSYPTDTVPQRMRLVAEAVDQIEHHPTMKQRIIAALKQGGNQAFEQALNHPAASFFIGAIEGWNQVE